MRLLPRQANLLRTHFHTRAGAVKCESSKKEKNCKEVALPDILPAYQTNYNPSPLRPLSVIISNICVGTSVNMAYCKKRETSQRVAQHDILPSLSNKSHPHRESHRKWFTKLKSYFAKNNGCLILPPSQNQSEWDSQTSSHPSAHFRASEIWTSSSFLVFERALFLTFDTSFSQSW